MHEKISVFIEYFRFQMCRPSNPMESCMKETRASDNRRQANTRSIRLDFAIVHYALKTVHTNIGLRGRYNVDK